MARIPRHKRRTDTVIADQYARVRSAMLGALLDLTARVLATLPDVELDELPRMADFARILGALDRTQCWTTLADYGEAAAEANRAVLESSPVAQAVITLVGRGGAWHGTPGELLDRLTPDPRPRDWPRTARGLSGQLARLAPALEDNGITVERPPTRGAQRTITLTRIPEVPNATAKAVKQPTRPTATSTQPTRDRHGPDQHQRPTRVGRVGQITLLTVLSGGPELRLGEWWSDRLAGSP